MGVYLVRRPVMMARCFHILPQASSNHLPIAAKKPHLEAALPCRPIADILRPTRGRYQLDAWYIPLLGATIQGFGLRSGTSPSRSLVRHFCHEATNAERVMYQNVRILAQGLCCQSRSRRLSRVKASRSLATNTTLRGRPGGEPARGRPPAQPGAGNQVRSSDWCAWHQAPPAHPPRLSPRSGKNSAT